MAEKLDEIKSFFGRLFSGFAADGGNSNDVRLGFGRIDAMLLPRSSLFIKGKYAAIDQQINYGWVQKKGRFFLHPKSESNPHIVISGMSGFGKSTLFKSLLLDIKKCGIPCIIFDAHNEHSEMVTRLGGTVHNAIYSGINILELDGASISERISELIRPLQECLPSGTYTVHKAQRMSLVYLQEVRRTLHVRQGHQNCAKDKGSS